ncbi:MAG: GGDEF domain-containing protein [Deltaproteobacteria bacterium]|nr:GGDEF domain-containing protein [Deltaproteobacteria bacterium]
MDDSYKEEGTLILTTPVRARPKQEQRGDACIILIHPPGSDIGRKTVLDKSMYFVGRDPSYDLCLARDSVSRRHAVIRSTSRGGWEVEDLDSTNGTFVNEQRVKAQPLFDGDQVRFGDAIYKFLTGENIESAYHEEIFQMTIVDGLTGVHNKRYFLDFIERELASASRHGNPLSLVMLDIDHFKQVNDHRGHLCGDEVLKQLAARVKPRIRREDLFARYGGEEFAAVLGCTDIHGALRFAEHLRGLIGDQPFEFEQEAFHVTISLGVACVHNQPDATVASLIQAADENLYRAKRGGRNQVSPPVPGV